MDSAAAQPNRGQPERFADDWASLFSEPRVNACAQENLPFWFRPPSQDPVTSTEMIKAFVNDLCEDSDPYLYQAVEVEGFCLPSDLAVLRAGNNNQVGKPIALLDDRNDEGTRIAARGTCRPRKGVLSAHRLFSELSKKRYGSRANSNSNLPTPAGVSVETNEPDADRRLIYVTDVDCWSILAIITTASQRQAGYLRNFIYRHLAFKTFLGVHIPSIGFPTFSLEFHLPFYAWRRTPFPTEDRRRRANGKPLRRSRDLNFLILDPSHGSGSLLEDCIYEAQISCIVTGFDERSWVGLAFVDTYYKGEDNRESVEYYEEQSANSTFHMDPLTGGRIDADVPIWKPREYFLRLLECRTDQVRQEWLNVVSRLLQITEQYTHDYLLPTDDLSPDHTERYNKRVQRFSNRTIRFIQQVKALLSKTIDAWDTFRQGDIGYFSRLELSSGRSGSYSRLLSTVDKYMSELQDLRQEVENQKQLLEHLEREVTQHLQQDSNKIASLQQQSGEHMRLLTVTALVFMPVSISSAIFSTNENILPFPRTFGSFSLITLCLGVIMLATSTAILNWSWHRVLIVRLSRSGSTRTSSAPFRNRTNLPSDRSGTPNRTRLLDDDLEMDPFPG